MLNLRIAGIFLAALTVAAAPVNGAPAAAPPKGGLPIITPQKAGELAQKTLTEIRDDIDKLAKKFPVLEGMGKSPVKGIAVPATEDDLIHLSIDFEKNVKHGKSEPGPDGSTSQSDQYTLVEKDGVRLKIALGRYLGKMQTNEPFWLAKVAGGPRVRLIYYIEPNPPDPELTKSVAAIIGAHVAQFTAQAAASAVPEKKEPAFEPKVLTLPIQKGQYVFVGSCLGPQQGGSGPGPEIMPAGRFHISAEAASDAWDIQITFEKTTNEDSEKVWNWKAVIRAKAPDGSMKQQEPCAEGWDMTRFYDKPVQEVPIAMADASKETGIEGLQFYKIPYVKVRVGGEVHYVVIATGKTMELFPKAITIPKPGFSDWNWKENWRELK